MAISEIQPFQVFFFKFLKAYLILILKCLNWNLDQGERFTGLGKVPNGLLRVGMMGVFYYTLPSLYNSQNP